jgi:membrane-bound serine protease (ClpP class)
LAVKSTGYLVSVPTWIKYLLFQIPGWVIAAIVLTVLWHWQLFPYWLALLCFAAWVVKDMLLYPLCRNAYESDGKSGAQRLVGMHGVAAEDLKPEGYVRIRGELWQAVAEPAGQFIAAGTRVEIVDSRGMEVFVRAVE